MQNQTPFTSKDGTLKDINETLERNKLIHQAETLVNEELGITDRRILPDRDQKNYDKLVEQKLEELYGKDKLLAETSSEKKKKEVADYKAWRKSLNDKETTRKIVDEEESLTELSKKTLLSYNSKAANDIKKSYDKDPRNWSKRTKNRHATYKKIIKKVYGENVEQVNELSQKTKNSYIRKAAGDLLPRGFDLGYNLAKRGEKDAPKSGADDTATNNRKVKNRLKGIKRATNESVDHDAAKELHLYADNHSGLYHQSHQPIINNLRKKVKKGTYDSTKAAKLWGYHADRAAKSYHKEHGDGKGKWHNMFNKATRNHVAKQMEKANRAKLHEEINENTSLVVHESISPGALVTIKNHRAYNGKVGRILANEGAGRLRVRLQNGKNIGVYSSQVVAKE